MISFARGKHAHLICTMENIRYYLCFDNYEPKFDREIPHEIRNEIMTRFKVGTYQEISYKFKINFRL